MSYNMLWNVIPLSIYNNLTCSKINKARMYRTIRLRNMKGFGKQRL